MCPPPPSPGGGIHSPWRERCWERPNSDERTYAVVLFIFTFFVVYPHALTDTNFDPSQLSLDSTFRGWGLLYCCTLTFSVSIHRGKALDCHTYTIPLPHRHLCTLQLPSADTHTDQIMMISGGLWNKSTFNTLVLSFHVRVRIKALHFIKVMLPTKCIRAGFIKYM